MIRHLGSSLTDVTYVFDEPTIGLHPHDIARMNALLRQLRDKGNTVLVVEHKPEAIAIADHVVDIGPRAGSAGGEIVFEGTVEGLRASGTLTGRHLDDRSTLKETVRESTARSRSAARPRTTCRVSTSTSRPGVLVVVTGGGGLGQELPDPRLGRRPRRCRRHRPGRHPRLPAQQPRHLHRTAGTDPQGVRQGQRRQAALFSANSEGACPQLQRQRRHLHRPRHDGRRRHHLRGVRGQAVRLGGAGLPPGGQGHQRGPDDARRRGGRVLRRG